MSYSDVIKIRSYALYIQGISCEEIARKISLEFEKNISAGTIRKWSEAKDARGYSWNAYREETKTAARQTIETQEKNRLIQIRDKAEILSERLFDNLTSEAAPKVSSQDGGTYAFKTISEFLLKLDEKAEKQVNVISVIQTVLEIFASVEEVKSAVQAHWQELEKEIRVRILHENPERGEDVKKLT